MEDLHTRTYRDGVEFKGVGFGPIIYYTKTPNKLYGPISGWEGMMKMYEYQPFTNQTKSTHVLSFAAWRLTESAVVLTFMPQGT